MENFIIKSVCSISILISLIVLFITDSIYVFMFCYLVMFICYFFIFPDIFRSFLIRLNLLEKESDFNLKI